MRVCVREREIEDILMRVCDDVCKETKERNIIMRVCSVCCVCVCVREREKI